MQASRPRWLKTSMKGCFFRSSASSRSLPNYFVQSKGNKQYVKCEITTVRANINQDVANNGLTLDDETLRDGNCGIDGVLRGLGRLEQKSQMIEAILKLLEGRGQLHVIDWLRKLAIAYLEDHLHDEFLEGVSIGDQILMDYSSVAEFTTKMSKPKEWVDATVLLGLAGALEIQIVIFTGANDPWVISTETLAAQNAPLVPLACVHNYHFWSLCPAAAETYSNSDVTKDASEKMNSLLPHLIESSQVRNDEGHGEPVEPDVLSHVKYKPQQQQTTERLEACVHLLTWQPFPDKFSMEGMTNVRSENSALVLQWREVLKPDSCSSKVIFSASLSIRFCLSVSCLSGRLPQAYRLLKFEEYDLAMGVDRENIYGLAKQWVSTTKKQCSDKYGRKLARVDAKLRRNNIVTNLMGPCSTCKVLHTCLDPFRACPDAVLTWRTHVVP